MSENLPAGWYTDESGTRKYWTGTEWIVPSAEAAPLLNDVDQTSAPTKAKPSGDVAEGDEAALLAGDYEPDKTRKPHRTLKVVLASVLALLLAGGGTTWYFVDTHNKAEAARIAAEELETKRKAAEKKAKEELEKAEAARITAEKVREAEALARVQAENIRKEQDDWMTSGDAGDKWSVAESGNVYYRYLTDEEYSCGWMNCFGVAVYTIKGCPSGVYIQASLMAGKGVIGYTNARIGYLAPEEVGSEILQFSDSGVDTTRIDEVNCY